MDALRTVSTIAQVPLISNHWLKPICSLSFNQKKPKSPTTQFPKSRFTKFTTISPSVSAKPISPPEEETETFEQDESFDWFSHWYALMPECDLDKRAPRGMKVLGLDVVVWWDKNQNEWRVFDDRCPHRLAPLSEGRIDQLGRLQCVYHGWCFSGSGNCKLIPQTPLDSPPVHSFQKACVGVYPSTMQYGIVWFWPSTDPQYKDILTKKKPPHIPELAHPSYALLTYYRDIPYGYEVLIENLMDPSHVPYSHHGIMRIAPLPSVKVDREGGTPIDISIQKLDKNGFTTIERPNHEWNFVAPCLLQRTLTIKESPDNTQEKLAHKPPAKDLFVFFCVPVSLGNSRLITVFPRYYPLWKDPFVSRWMHHIMQNLIIDSDFYLLRVQEEKLTEAGPLNWEKVCFVPTKADTNVVAFRKWLKKYSGGQFNWGPKFNGNISPTPLREQLMDRYWSHVVNCSSCNGTYRGFNALKISLQVFSVALVAITVASKPVMLSTSARNTLAVVAVLCFVGSKWLSHFIYKNFHFHDYNHAFK